MKLSNITTIKTGGEARKFFRVKNLDDLHEAVNFSKKENLPIMVIGEGSNMLISDSPVERVVIQLTNKDIIKSKAGKKVRVKVGSGMRWDEFVEWSVRNNYQGIECLSYIPGFVGAAPVQNIGAYGQELSDTFYELEAYDTKTQKLTVFDKPSVDFKYRDSVFKKPKNDGRYIIYTVTLDLNPDGKPDLEYKSLKDYLDSRSIKDPSLKEVRDAVIQIRKTKLEDPKQLANAGSFFKNPIVSERVLESLQDKFPDIPSFKFDDDYKIPAGWLIEKSGWKGRKYKDVGVSDKHALVLVNYDKGNASQIHELARKIINDVRERFGIELEQEVRNY